LFSARNFSPSLLFFSAASLVAAAVFSLMSFENSIITWRTSSGLKAGFAPLIPSFRPATSASLLISIFCFLKVVPMSSPML
jgi:hypothetical protein